VLCESISPITFLIKNVKNTNVDMLTSFFRISLGSRLSLLAVTMGSYTWMASGSSLTKVVGMMTNL
jgi:hypothetical protein